MLFYLFLPKKAKSSTLAKNKRRRNLALFMSDFSVFEVPGAKIYASYSYESK